MSTPTSKLKVPEMPAFLRRDSKEFRALAKKASKRVVVAAETADPDEKLHALAASMGLRRHQYQVHWLRDPKWVEAYRVMSAERTAEREAKAEKKKATKMPKAPKPKKQKAATAKLEELPQGRIVVVSNKNPKNKDSDAWKRWDTLFKYHGRTVESYVLDKHNTTTLKNAIKSNHVRVKSDAEVETEPATAGVGEPDERPVKGKRRAGQTPTPTPAEPRAEAAKPRKKGK